MYTTSIHPHEWNTNVYAGRTPTPAFVAKLEERGAYFGPIMADGTVDFWMMPAPTTDDLPLEFLMETSYDDTTG